MTNANAETWPKRIAIVGVGLLGGSVARSLRRRIPDLYCVGIVRSQAKRDATLQSGVFDAAFDTLEDAVADCDVIVVATPVDRIADIVHKAAEISPEDCLITDVGSTKAGIVDTIAADSLSAGKFVAAHPIAGSEKTGLENSDAALFDDKLVVITPADETKPDLLDKAERFWQLTGGRTVRMSPIEHDAHLAAVSHVPHLMAAVVALQTSRDSRSFVGSGWRDITRVASGDPTMWTAICQENRKAIQHELGRVKASIDELIEIIDREDDDALHHWLIAAKSTRDQTLPDGNES